MTRQTYSQARRLVEDAQTDIDRFEAFLIGYVAGAQDIHAEIELETDEDFRERVKELYRNEYPEAFV